MKKLLLTVAVLGMVGCCNIYNHKLVVKAKFIKNGYCEYYYDGLGSFMQSFHDDCNKYNIGDTIK